MCKKIPGCSLQEEARSVDRKEGVDRGAYTQVLPQALHHPSHAPSRGPGHDKISLIVSKDKTYFIPHYLGHRSDND